MFALSSALIGIVCVAVAANVAPEIPTVPNVLDGAPDPLVKAVEHRIDSIKVAPTDPERWTDLGQTYEAAGLTCDAAACYRTSLSLNSIQPRVLYRLALACEDTGDIDCAERSMRLVIRHDDSYAPAMARLGHWLLWQGELDEAEAWLLEARDVDRWHTPSWIGLARVCLAQDRSPEAVVMMDDMLSWAVVNQRVANNLLATATRQAGSPDAAQSSHVLIHGPPMEFDWEDPWSLPVIELQRALGLAPEMQPGAPGSHDNPAAAAQLETTHPVGGLKPVPAEKIRVERPTMSRL